MFVRSKSVVQTHHAGHKNYMIMRKQIFTASHAVNATVWY
jgi:hypothetical protein